MGLGDFGLGAWLTKQLGGAGARRAVSFVFGTEQERALHDVGRRACERTAADLATDDQAGFAAAVEGLFDATSIDASEAFRHEGLLASLGRSIEGVVAHLDDPALTGIGSSYLSEIGVEGDNLARALTWNVLVAIREEALTGGALNALWRELSEEATRLGLDAARGLSEQTHETVLEMLAELRRQGSTLTAMAAAGTAAALPRPLATVDIPSEPEHFVGRDSELATVRQRLSVDRARVVVSGEAGVGKSALATISAQSFRGELDIAWISGRTQADARAGLMRLGLALFPDLHDGASRLREVGKWLEAESLWLLVVDDVADWAVLGEVLPPGARGRVLVTSRTPDPADGWTLVRLGSLTRRQSEDLFRSHGLEAPIPPALLRRLRGLPLAMHQAATYVSNGHEGIEEYLVLLDELEHSDALDRSKGPSWLTTLVSLGRLSPSASEALFRLAQYAPRRIPTGLVSRYPTKAYDERDGLSREIEAAVSELERLRLVHREEGLFVHEEIQAAIRYRLARGRDLERWIAEAVFVVDAAIPPDLHTRTALEAAGEIAPHATVVATRALHYQVEAELTSAVLRRIGVYWTDTGSFGESIRLLRMASEIMDGVTTVERAEVLLELGRAVFSSGDHHRSLEPLIAGIEQIRPEAGSRARDVEAQLLNEAGAIWLRLGDPDLAAEYLRRSLAVLESSAPDNPWVGVVLNDLARVLEDREDEWSDATELYERALTILETEYGSASPWVATVLGNHGRLLHKKGDLRKARQFLERALEIDRDHYGEFHIKVATRNNNLAPVLQDVGSLAEARAALQTAIEIWTKVYGPWHTNIAAAKTNLGRLMIESQQTERAIDSLLEALEVWARLEPENNVVLARAWYHLARAYRKRGETQLARRSIDKAVEIERGLPAVASSNAADTLALLGEIAVDGGRYDEAQVALDEARAVLSSTPAETRESIQHLDQRLASAPGAEPPSVQRSL